MKKIFALAGLSAVSCFAATFTTYSSPDAGYQALTTYINLSSLPDSTTVSSVTDGVLTVFLSNNLTKVSQGSGWSTWSSVPDSQFTANDGHPILVGYLTGSPSSVVFTFSTPVSVFGLEAEPDATNTDMTLTFFNGVTTVGTVTRTVSWSSGSLLFAASGDAFTSVQLSTGDGDDFGVAGIRYSLGGSAVPEPGTVGMLAAGLLAGGLALRRRRITV